MGTGVEEVAAAEAVKGGTEALAAETVAGTAAGGTALGDAAAWEMATAGMGEGMGSAAGWEAATAGMGTGMGDAAAWEAATAGMGTGMGLGEGAAAGAGGATSIGSPTASAGAPDAFSPSMNYGPGMTGAETSAYDTTVGLTGSPGLAQAASGAWGAVEPYVGTALKAANTALPYASLANSIYQQGKAGDRLGSVSRSAGQTGEVASQLLSQYQTGQLSGADQQAIVQHKQQQLAAIDQYYQRAGLSNSSMHVQARAQVESQAETMRQQALENTLKSGLNASGVSNQAALAAAQAGLAQDKDTSAALAEFMKVLGQMNTPQKTTGTPGS